MKLLIGTKAYSSWSLRPWILMRHFDLSFAGEMVALYQPGTVERVRRFSKAGKLPVLVDGDIVVWESSRSSTTWPSATPTARSGRPIALRGPMRVPLRPRCMRASRRCATGVA